MGGDVVGEPVSLPVGEVGLTDGESGGEEGGFVCRTGALLEARIDVTGCTATLELSAGDGLGLGLGLGLAEGVSEGEVRCCAALLPRFDAGGLEL